MSEPERLTPEQLRTLFLFEDLDDEQLAWLAATGRIVEYPPGAIIHAEGGPASCFFVLLSGTLAMSTRVQGGELELFRTDFYGAYTGAFEAYLDDRTRQMYTGTARAVTECRLFELPAAEFGRAVRKWFPMATHLLVGLTTQGRAATDTVARHERLVALGAVTAGLTHELNNPVTAIVRAASGLREKQAGMRAAVAQLARGGLGAEQLEALADLAKQAIDNRADAPHLSAMETTDREDELADWLERQGVDAAWEHAATLVAAGVDVEWAEALARAVQSSEFDAGLTYAVSALEAGNMLDEITDAAGRISALLASAKQYTQMDRAPMQSFDVHEGIDATLTMMGHKLGPGIVVVREYDRSIPRISAYPGELNQVWTNLIDNAVDAMGGAGTLTVRTGRERDDHLVVEIGDTGPGVPDEIRSRVFEPFFTTKDIGQGTGLGLDIAWRIVVGRHEGEIRFESEPGDTRFQVVLPIREPESHADEAASEAAS